MSLPPVADRVCAECPWMRRSEPGHLGPYGVDGWLRLVHSDQPIACHKTITKTNEEDVGDWSHPHMRQCQGAAVFRSNVWKKPRDPEVVTLPANRQAVFGGNDEFREHHTVEVEDVD